MVIRYFLPVIFLISALISFKADAINLEWDRENSRLARQFMRIVTTTEHGNLNPKKVTRWVGPIHLKVTGKIPKSADAFFTLHLNLLKSIGIDISSSNKGDTMEVAFIDPASFAIKAKQDWPSDNLPECYGTNRTYSGGKQNGRILSSYILIPYDLPRDKMRGCIEEEITQTLGLLNDSFELVDSLFNDENLYDRLSDSDKVFISLLYHPSVKIGMSSDNLYVTALNILNKWHPQGKKDALAASKAISEPSIKIWENSLKKAFYYGKSSNDKYFLDQYRKAKSIEENGVIEAQGALHLGKYYLSINSIDQAIYFIEKSDKIFSNKVRLKSLKLAQVAYYLGSALLKKEKYLEAKTEFNKALGILEEWPNHILTNKVGVSLARALIGEGQINKARDLSRKLIDTITYPDELKVNAAYYFGIASLMGNNPSDVRYAIDLMNKELYKMTGDHKRNTKIAIESLSEQFKSMSGNN